MTTILEKASMPTAGNSGASDIPMAPVRIQHIYFVTKSSKGSMHLYCLTRCKAIPGTATEHAQLEQIGRRENEESEVIEEEVYVKDITEKFNGRLVSLGRQIIVYVPDAHSMISCRATFERSIENVNTMWWGPITSRVVGMFRTHTEALRCLAAKNLVPFDPRFAIETLDVINSIDDKDPSFTVPHFTSPLHDGLHIMSGQWGEKGSKGYAEIEPAVVAPETMANEIRFRGQVVYKGAVMYREDPDDHWKYERNEDDLVKGQAFADRHPDDPLFSLLVFTELDPVHYHGRRYREPSASNRPFDRKRCRYLTNDEFIKFKADLEAGGLRDSVSRLVEEGKM